MILYNASSSYYSMIGRYSLLEAGISFESRRMDIHLAKEQLSSWYLAINPAMTVPTLIDGEQSWLDSQTILKFAASCAREKWMDADAMVSSQIDEIVKAHYAIPIERLTFSKALVRIPPLRFIVPRMLRSIIRKLEEDLTHSTNPTAIQAKITLNHERLAYFTEGNLMDKLQVERDRVQQYIQRLPTPAVMLFGDKPSSADILTVVLFGRLKMIGEYPLVPFTSPLIPWFERMQGREAYKDADIWTHFQPWRILLKR